MSIFEEYGDFKEWRKTLPEDETFWNEDRFKF